MDAAPAGKDRRSGRDSSRSASRSSRRASTDSPLAVAVTAEIPAVAAPTWQRSQGAAPSSSATSRQRRQPAPLLLRACVWFLVLVLLLAGAGLWAERSHPSWFTSLRAKVPGAAPALGSKASVPGSSATPTTVGSPRPGAVSASATGETVAVPAGAYSVVLDLNTAHPCWMKVVSPAGSSTVVFEQVVQPSSSPQTVTLTRSAVVTLGAEARSIEVRSAGRAVADLTAPKILPYTYTFMPVRS